MLIVMNLTELKNAVSWFVSGENENRCLFGKEDFELALKLIKEILREEKDPNLTIYYAKLIKEFTEAIQEIDATV